ncbi:MAG: hypothetical protein Q9219_002422 [cf. Caloplaca sp. 3 TL-2023]
MEARFDGCLEHTLPSVLEAALQVVPEVLGSAKDWIGFCPWNQLDLVANLMMQRVWFGAELSQDSGWHRYSVMGERNFYAIADELSEWHFLLKPLAARFSPRIRRFNENMIGAQKYLIPMIRKHTEQQESPKYEEKDGGPAESWIKWWTQASRLDSTYQATMDRQCELIMYTFYDATFALRWNLSMGLFDLAAYPEYIEPLRQEIREKFDTAQNPASISTLRSMTKLDSWMKESLRKNPPAYSVKLGFTTAQRGMDPKYWERALEFDGFRFEKMREAGQKKNLDYTYTGSTLDMATFGKGVQYCPARFLMEYSIKLGLISLLKNYDFRLLSGETQRPMNPCNGINPLPPPGKLLVRQVGA